MPPYIDVISGMFNANVMRKGATSKMNTQAGAPRNMGGTAPYNTQNMATRNVYSARK